MTTGKLARERSRMRQGEKIVMDSFSIWTEKRDPLDHNVSVQQSLLMQRHLYHRTAFSRVNQNVDRNERMSLKLLLVIWVTNERCIRRVRCIGASFPINLAQPSLDKGDWYLAHSVGRMGGGGVHCFVLKTIHESTCGVFLGKATYIRTLAQSNS